MNVFVLCTGRSGSVTFYNACKHITNFSSAHESNFKKLPADRLNYPENHIEIDNRLSWFTGKLDKKYGNSAVYVHLKRDFDRTAESFNRRWKIRNSVISAYSHGILACAEESIDICKDYCITVNTNIELLMKDKANTLTMNLENISEDFKLFWEKIGAEGNIEAALKELNTKYNATKKKQPQIETPMSINHKSRPAQNTPHESLKGFPSELTGINIKGKNQSYTVRIPKAELFRIKEIFQEQGYSILKYRNHNGPLNVLDIGANIGLFSIYMKLIDPDCTIYCYEPVNNTYSLLQENIKNINNIHTFHYGLFNENTTAEINIHSMNTGQNSLKLKNPEHNQTETIQLRDAGEENDRLGIDNFDILKVDTEGCEVEILESLGERLSNIAYVILEYHSEEDRRRLDKLLVDFTLFANRMDIIGFGTAKYINNSLLEKFKATVH